MGRETPLYEMHVAAGARMVDFGGWKMPLHYGSQIEEHHAVRRRAGLFDVSHMTLLDMAGGGLKRFLRRLLASDVSVLEPGAAQYGCMLNENGGVIDDLIVYRLGDRYRAVLNAATRERDMEWIERQAADSDVELRVRDDLAMIAVQGPEARSLTAGVLGAAGEDALSLRRFSFVDTGRLFVARTGYTGEDGFEIVLPASEAGALWEALADAGAAACGLAARDTLRLEAGLNLYGADMDESVSPLESGLGWTVALEPEDRDFIGRAPLERQRREGGLRRFSGLLLQDRGILRNGQRVLVEGYGEGSITSGGYGPTLQRSIAMARLPAGEYSEARVDVRGRLLAARVVDLPFVRNGKVRVEV